MLSHKDEGGVEQILSIHFTGGGGRTPPYTFQSAIEISIPLRGGWLLKESIKREGGGPPRLTPPFN